MSSILDAVTKDSARSGNIPGVDGGSGPAGPSSSGSGPGRFRSAALVVAFGVAAGALAAHLFGGGEPNAEDMLTDKASKRAVVVAKGQPASDAAVADKLSEKKDKSDDGRGKGGARRKGADAVMPSLAVAASAAKPVEVAAARPVAPQPLVIPAPPVVAVIAPAEPAAAPVPGATPAPVGVTAPAAAAFVIAAAPAPVPAPASVIAAAPAPASVPVVAAPVTPPVHEEEPAASEDGSPMARPPTRGVEDFQSAVPAVPGPDPVDMAALRALARAPKPLPAATAVIEGSAAAGRVESSAPGRVVVTGAAAATGVVAGHAPVTDAPPTDASRSTAAPADGGRATEQGRVDDAAPVAEAGDGLVDRPDGAPEISIMFVAWSRTPSDRLASLRVGTGTLNVVHEGEYIEGVEISAIHPEAVDFQWTGQKFRVAVRPF